MIEIKDIRGTFRRGGVTGKHEPLYLNTVYNADIVPGKSIRLHGLHQNSAFNVSFELGGIAEYDSFNMHYCGKIISITPKTVTIQERDGTKHRLSLYEFSWRNYDYDAEKIAKINLDHSNAI